MSELTNKQQLFARLICSLLNWIYAHEGWGVTFGEAYRPEELTIIYAKREIGIKDSLHIDRLAIDLNFFINGVYQTDSEAYKPLGEFWEELDEDCRWGGRFKKPDGNHFSLAYGGRA